MNFLRKLANRYVRYVAAIEFADTVAHEVTLMDDTESRQSVRKLVRQFQKSRVQKLVVLTGVSRWTIQRKDDGGFLFTLEASVEGENPLDN